MPVLSSHLSKFCPKTADFFARTGPIGPRYAPGERDGSIVGVAVGTGVTVGSTAGI